MKTQQGFMLIVLLSMMIFLGIFGVNASPSLIRFGSDARVSAVQALAGAIERGAKMVFSRAAMKGIEQQSGDKTQPSQLLLADGQKIALAYGYPTHEALSEAAQLNAWLDLNIVRGQEKGDWDIRITNTPSMQVHISPAAYTPLGSGLCTVVYRQAQSETVPPVIKAYVDGC